MILSTNHGAYNPQNEPGSYNTKAHLVLQAKIRSFSSSGITAPVSSSYYLLHSMSSPPH